MNTVVSVLTAQRNLLEYLPQLGHIPRLVSHLSSKNLTVARAATLATHQFTHNQVYIFFFSFFNILNFHIKYCNCNL